MKKQTAVEWVVDKLPIMFKYESYYVDILQQAKAMEKEQIISANEDCSTNELGELFTGEQYYNETYGK